MVLTGLGVFFAAQLVFAVTAANSVPASKLGQTSQAITANTLKPSNCSGITVTTILTGSGVISGTSAAELILGSSGIDTITGSSGNDCIVAGAGVDSLSGGGGTDVCLGGPDTDTFTASCETQVQ